MRMPQLNGKVKITIWTVLGSLGGIVAVLLFLRGTSDRLVEEGASSATNLMRIEKLEEWKSEHTSETKPRLSEFEQVKIDLKLLSAITARNSEDLGRLIQGLEKTNDKLDRFIEIHYQEAHPQPRRSP